MHTRVHAKQPLVPIHRYTRVHTQRTPRDRNPDTRTRKDRNPKLAALATHVLQYSGSGRSDSLRGLCALLTWRWRRGFREPSVYLSLDPCVQWPSWRVPRRSEAAQKCPARSLSPSLPPTALSPLPARSAHPLSPSAPPRRLPGGGCDPGRAAAEGRASRERNPLAPRAQLPRSSRVRSQGGPLGGGVRLTSPPLASPSGPGAHLSFC